MLPLVRARVPAARLRLVGARPAAAVRRLTELEGVELAADVPEMAAELQRAAVAVLPSFSGSGIKNKVLEAFCVGLPVVANRARRPGGRGRRRRRALPGGGGRRRSPRPWSSVLGDAAAADAACRRPPISLVAERYSWQRQAQRLLELYGAGAAS